MDPLSEKGDTPASPSNEEEDYYAAVELHFVQLRGSPLFITPQDWQLIHDWRQIHIPLRVVKDGLDRAFERRKPTRAVRRLAYCRQSVVSAYRRHCEVLAGSTGKDDDAREATATIQSHIRELEVRLRDLSENRTVSHHRLAEVAGLCAERLASRLSQTLTAGQIQEIEEELDRLDEELVEVAESSLEESERHRCRDEAERSLAEYRARMPTEVYESALRSAYLKRVRACRSLPPLSLSYL